MTSAHVLNRSERGSALLIVFLLAAVIAIMLYMEMPVAAFEAQRQKEQLAIDRGNEYAHAVKLFVRKMGTYPTSIDQLENTNRMRFLRHRFKDPLTGKDDWRLLHAGAGGMLIDSKVNPITANNQNVSGSASGSATTGSSSSTFASTTNNLASSSFGNNSPSSFGSTSNSSASSTNSSSDQVQVAPVPQRAPAIAANGAGTSGEAPIAGSDQTSFPQVLAPGQAVPFPNTQNPSAPQNATQPPVPGQPGVQNNPGTGAVTDPSNTTPMLRNLLSNPNAPIPQTPATQAAPAASQNSPQIVNGAIAGVASKAEGRSIKTVKDQTKYSFWEFYYDPTKDALPGGLPGAVPAAAAPATNAGSFGASSFTQNSSFGQQAPNSTQPAPTPAPGLPAITPPGLPAQNPPPQ